MAVDINIESQIVVQTAAQWAADATVYSQLRILVVSDQFFGTTDQRKFKIADGVQTFANLDFVPIVQPNATTDRLPVKNVSGGFSDSNLRHDGSGLIEAITKFTALDGFTCFTNGNGFYVFDSTGTKELLRILNTGAVNIGWTGSASKFIVTDPTDARALIQTAAGFIFGEESSNLFGLFTGSAWAWDTNKTTGVTTFFFAPKLDSLTASTILELDASKNMISAAKGTAYNKNFGATSGTVAAGNDSRFNDGVVIDCGFNTFNLADLTTYHFATNKLITPITSSQARAQFTSPITGSVNSVRLNLNYTVGSNEATTIKVRNVTTAQEITVTSTLDFSAAATTAGYYFSGLNLAVSAGDNLECQIVCPNWATNPVSVTCAMSVYIKVS